MTYNRVKKFFNPKTITTADEPEPGMIRWEHPNGDTAEMPSAEFLIANGYTRAAALTYVRKESQRLQAAGFVQVQPA